MYVEDRGSSLEMIYKPSDNLPYIPSLTHNWIAL